MPFGHILMVLHDDILDPFFKSDAVWYTDDDLLMITQGGLCFQQEMRIKQEDVLIFLKER